jgi:glycosyltransferase involved in cell wall biosynthesis
MVGPDTTAEGGIAAVLRNYQRTPFWRRFRVHHHASSGPGDGVRELLYQVLQLLRYPLAIDRVRPDVVAIHTSSRRCFYRSVAYLALTLMAQRPVVLHVHPASFVEGYRRGTEWHRGLVRWALARCSQIVVLTDGIADELRALVPGVRVMVIPNPVDTSEFRPSEVPPSEPPVVLYMGAILREKGAFDLVDAMPEVLRRWPDAVFAFAGNRHLKFLTEQLATRGVSASARVLGWVDGEERLRLLASSRVLVLPSHSEGLPNVILEAMASGLPVVATAVGGVPSIISDGIDGLLVPAHDRDRLVGAIDRLLGDAGLRQELAARGRQTVIERYSMPAVSAALTSLYRRFRAPGPDPMPVAGVSSQ